MKNDALTTESSKEVCELGENIEVVGPGQMLSEARNKLLLSTEDVSSRLNFRTNLVHEIEQDLFDPKLPVTFYRGYLRNYAKLVDVDVDEVLSAYDMLSVAEIQRSEMQSFSNLTVKQAEHSRLMWISYLIAALLFGLMVVWWVQEPKLPVNLFDKSGQDEAITTQVSDIANESVNKSNVKAPGLSVEPPVLPKAQASVSDEVTKSSVIKKPVNDLQKFDSAIANTPPEKVLESQKNILIDVTETKVDVKTTLVPEMSNVVFTFLGDCWVNIYDATGERIAWGVKKSGYVMTVSGKTPLKVTLGKPELATIAFNGEQVDMSSFNAGNIAKFTLPLITP